ncbi:DUF3800 domain-containing protein [Candidatus Sumerlaeota bacterium]|nr:DUF3800 domain-containing protein [Candidatus Sumerlaeota bacterium]
MSEISHVPPSTRHYFVDESGDGILFDRRGRILLSREGAPKFFILGLADVENTGALNRSLDELRHSLLADPYFKGVPSMQPGERKTALFFHAKDDLPEIRREVFKLLVRHEIKFFAVVKRMQNVLDYVLRRNRRDPVYRYKPNELYDHTVKRLFKARLHKDDRYFIHFARRSKSDRTRILAESLEAARERFCKEQGVESKSVISVKCMSAHEEGGLQAVDYFLWALQRAYERKEDRFIQLLWPQISLVHDVDDTREKKYGIYYSRTRPLTAKEIG